MKNVQFRLKVIRLSLLLITAAVCSAFLFLLCYYNDNKYTLKSPQPKNGVLLLTERDLQDNPFVYLITDWEIYRGKLLAPEDFTTALLMPDEYVYIGQYGGFEGNIRDGGAVRSPHGSATYRLNIGLPPEPKSYTLELPEIYSSYRLYINGEFYAGMGNPDRETYSAETGNSKVTLRCNQRMEIILAVSDYSHFYSGMVYPPAFGESTAVEKVLNTRFGLRVAAVAVALGVGILYLGIWLLLGNDKSGVKENFLPLYYAALCLCFAIYICYPVVKTLWPSGVGWYSLENLAFTAILMLVALIQSRVSGFPKRIAVIFTALGIIACLWAILVPRIMGDSLNLMMAYSTVLTAYSWAVGLFLLISAAYGVYKNFVNSQIILTGAAVFGTSLIMDRLLPLFEPVRFGWFSEISGGVLVLSIGLVMAIEVVGQIRLRQAMEVRIESVSRMLDVQRAYYPFILEKAEEVRAARHDLRHHFSVIRELIKTGDKEKLYDYLEKYGGKQAFPADVSYCRHYVVNMLLRMYAGLAEKQDTAFRVEADLPEDLPIDDVDLCVMISNVLENAVEASGRVTSGNRQIIVRIGCELSRLAVLVENYFDGCVQTENRRFFSSKKENGEGVGIASVEAVAGRYGGDANFYAEGYWFISEIFIPVRGSKKEKTE